MHTALSIPTQARIFSGTDFFCKAAVHLYLVLGLRSRITPPAQMWNDACDWNHVERERVRVRGVRSGRGCLGEEEE
jgi:hypothetical protein